MIRTPLPVADLVERLAEAAQSIEASAPPVVDEQVERILGMVAPALPWRGRLPPYERPVLLTREELAALDDYSLSLPSGVRPGRRWRCDVNAREVRPGPARWMLGEYVDGPTPDTCRVRWRPIVVRLTLADLEWSLYARRGCW